MGLFSKIPKWKQHNCALPGLIVIRSHLKPTVFLQMIRKCGITAARFPVNQRVLGLVQKIFACTQVKMNFYCNYPTNPSSMMTPMYRSIIFALSLSAVFFLSNSSANAQEQVFIFGDQYLCPGQCGAWFIEFPTSDDYLYELQFVGAIGFFFEITSEGYDPVTTCDLFEPGSYSIEVTVFSPDGVIIAQGGYEFFVDFEGDLFGEVYGTHTTECEQDTFAFTFPGGLNDCYEVCVGTVSTISLDEILLSGGISDSLIISQGQWSVSNGTIQPNGSTGGDANFNIPEVFASSGQEVCLPITVNNFDNIAGGQFSINYNAAILTNVAATSVTNEIPGFSIESISFPTPGSVTVSWSSVGTATTLPDGSELFELCFFVSGTTSSAVLFSSAPTPAEIIDGNGNVVPFDGSSGAVIIGTAPPEVITILWDEEGPGFASFNFWTVTPNGCEVFSSIDFCFDVVPPPPADFTTQPPAGPSGILEICEGQTVFLPRNQPKLMPIYGTLVMVVDHLYRTHNTPLLAPVLSR